MYIPLLNNKPDKNFTLGLIYTKSYVTLGWEAGKK